MFETNKALGLIRKLELTQDDWEALVSLSERRKKNALSDVQSILSGMVHEIVEDDWESLVEKTATILQFIKK